jgi:hypothetical protein
MMIRIRKHMEWEKDLSTHDDSATGSAAVHRLLRPLFKRRDAAGDGRMNPPGGAIPLNDVFD